jgi:hypothetical protein
MPCRLRAKGSRVLVTEDRLTAYPKLVNAGIMEPIGDDYRFTGEGWARRETLLVQAEERLERRRFEPPDASNLSEAARDLLRRWLAGDGRVADANPPL